MALSSAQEADLVSKIREIQQNCIETMPDHRILEELQERRGSADPDDIVDQIVLGEYEIAATRRGLIKNPGGKLKRRAKANPSSKKRRSKISASRREELADDAFEERMDALEGDDYWKYSVDESPEDRDWREWKDREHRLAQPPTRRLKWTTIEDGYPWSEAYLEGWDDSDPISHFEWLIFPVDGGYVLREEKNNEPSTEKSYPDLESAKRSVKERYFSSENPKKRLAAGGRVPKKLSKTMAKRKAKAKAKKNPARPWGKKGLDRWLRELSEDDFEGLEEYGEYDDLFEVMTPAQIRVFMRKKREFMKAAPGPKDFPSRKSGRLDAEDLRSELDEVDFDYDNPKKRLVAGGRVPKGLSKTMAKRKAKAKATAKAKKNPCIGLHFHAKDADELLEAAEKSGKRQGNPKKKAKRKSKKKAAKKKTLGGRAKRAGRKIEKRTKVLAVDAERGAEKAGRKLKKYGATKQGYTVAGAGLGAILLGPLGAVAGAMGGSALHDNPGAMMNPTALNEMLRLRLPEMSDKEVVDVYEQYYTMYTESARPEMDYGEEGVELIRSVIKDTSEEIRRRDLKSNPKKKKGSKRRGNPTDPVAAGVIRQVEYDSIVEGARELSDRELIKAIGQYSGDLSSWHDPERALVYHQLFVEERARRGIPLSLPNPKKKKGSKLKTKAKKAGRKAKKFAKTKEGYGALGAGAGALLLGPIGAVAGAIGGTKLHGNPGRRKNPTKGQHHALADRKWNMFESSWDSFSISNSPEDLLGAYMAVVQAELHYAHAGIENDEGRGYGPAGAEAEGIRQQISERLGG